MKMGWHIGIDTGGTFTDLVAIDGSTMRVAKVPSTPPDFEQGIVNSIIAADIPFDEIDAIAHGTTVATNAVITGNTAPTALLTTRGFRDVLQLGRHNRGEPFDILWDPPTPLVQRRHRYEINERVDYVGRILTPIDLVDVERAIELAVADAIESFAICFLHSHMNSAHEEAAHERILKLFPGVSVCHSAELLREPPEFERTSTTVINASLMPVVASYLTALRERLADAGFVGDLSVMHSGGGLMTAESAARFPARLVTSGPAAGAKAAEGIAGAIPAATGSPAATIVVAEQLAAAEGLDRLISLDIGGTSADIALIRDGKARTVTEFSPQFGQPIRFPAIDLLTIGAGGGSIAWVDKGGLPHVGPQSAGARPGPAAYGLGGVKPTVTDANVVLGRLPANVDLAGGIQLDLPAAEEAVRAFGDPLGLDLNAAALGILEICNSNMAKSIRVVTVNRGLDPRDFSLVPFGGGGGMQAADLAEVLGIRRIVVPVAPGVTSGLGCLCVDIVHDASEALITPISQLDVAAVNGVLTRLGAAMVERLTEDEVSPEDQSLEFSADVRYLGQVRGLTLPLGGSQVGPKFAEEIADAFFREYERQFHSYSTEIPIELAALRVQGSRPVKPPRIPFKAGASSPQPQTCEVVTKSGVVSATVVHRSSLTPGTSLSGPLIVTQDDSTTWVPPRWTVDVNPIGNLIMTMEGA
jgi:N-methylhydantoinase A